MADHAQTSTGPWAGRSRRLFRCRHVVVVALLAPALGLRLFTAVYPFIDSVRMSLFSYNPAFPPARYIGLGNFSRLLTDMQIRESVTFTVLFVLISTALELSIGLLLASLLSAPSRLRSLLRAVTLIPWAMPMVVTALGFRWMFDVDYGIIADMVARVTGARFGWLTDFWGARWAVILTNVWKSTPFVAIVLLAGLQAIPSELYEALRVDGGTSIQSFRFITVPMLLPQVVTIGLFMIVWQLAAFDLVFAMTGGGPGFATQVLAWAIYQHAFAGLNFGYASAISVLLFAVVFVAGGLGLALYRRVQLSY